MRFSFLLPGLLLLATPAHAGDAFKQDQSLKLNYEMECASDTNAFPGITAELKLKDHTIRFQLFKYVTETEISLGTDDSLDPKNLPITFLPSPNCTLNSWSAEINPVVTEDLMERLALENSPYLVLRKDQYDITDRDVPMGLTYSIVPRDEGGFTLLYTMFFSNETVHGLFSTSKPASLGHYGRRTDIEWIYSIDFDQNGNSVARQYQGGLVDGKGHKTHDFKGEYLPDSRHPILYDIANHNVFKDKPTSKVQRENETGYQLMARETLEKPDAREIWMWRHPWTFKVSDLELARDKKLSHTSDEYLYVLLDGTIDQGSIKVSATLDGETRSVPAGEGKNKLKELGEGLWDEQSFTAIWLGSGFTSRHGVVSMSPHSSKTSLHYPRFFHLIPNDDNGFDAEEITTQFECQDATVCRF